MPALRRVTAADVARAAGVSRATVGFVLNQTPGQTISEETRARVTRAAAELGYRPNHAARTLAGGSTEVVVLLLPQWPVSEVLHNHVERMAQALDTAGYTLLTWTPGRDPSRRPLWETIRVDAVVGLSPLTERQQASVRASGAVPVVPTPDAVGGSLTHDQGPVLQVEHLVSRGCSRLAYASSPLPRLADLDDQRWQAARAAAERHGLELRRLRIDQTSLPTVVDDVREHRLDGLAAYNDEVAAVVLRTLLKAGVAVPDDLALVGHDDAFWAALMVPALSTISVDVGEVAAYLAQLVLHHLGRAEAPPAPDVTPRLVVRETS